MPSVSDAEIAELHAILGDLSKKYGSLDGDLTNRIKQLEGAQKSIVSTGGYSAPPFRETLMLSKELRDRPLPAQRGMVIRVPMSTKDILNVSRDVPQFVGVTGGPQKELRVRDLIPS